MVSPFWGSQFLCLVDSVSNTDQACNHVGAMGPRQIPKAPRFAEGRPFKGASLSDIEKHMKKQSHENHHVFGKTNVFLGKHRQFSGVSYTFGVVFPGVCLGTARLLPPGLRVLPPPALSLRR